MTRAISEGIVDENTIEEVLNFYNMAITSILSAMATEIGKAQSPNNWRLIMTAYNMIKIVDSAGIGLVYGLRYYGNGKLKPDEIIPYVQHHGLLWAYYGKVIEIVPKDLKNSLEAMYRGSDFKTLRDRFVPRNGKNGRFCLHKSSRNIFLCNHGFSLNLLREVTSTLTQGFFFVQLLQLCLK